MSDNYPMDPQTVRSHGTRGVLSTGAGVGLWVVNGLLHLPIVGQVLSVGLIALGLMGLFGREKADKATGGLLMVAGAVGLGSLVLGGLTSTLFGLSGLVLVGYGIYNLVKFAKGVKSRG